jgi:hypothetical protein
MTQRRDPHGDKIAVLQSCAPSMGLRMAFLARFIGRSLVALRFIAGRASERQVKMRIAVCSRPWPPAISSQLHPHARGDHSGLRCDRRP